MLVKARIEYLPVGDNKFVGFTVGFEPKVHVKATTRRGAARKLMTRLRDKGYHGTLRVMKPLTQEEIDALNQNDEYDRKRDRR